jgi:hypothetical protein
MPRPYIFAPLEVNSSKTTVRITGQIAVTRIEQEFYNPNLQRLEGTFVFPVPKGAHLDKFTMEIDGRQVEAELLSADKARGIYEDIVRTRDPLECADRDMFKVRIFPIEPHSGSASPPTPSCSADDGPWATRCRSTPRSLQAGQERELSRTGKQTPPKAIYRRVTRSVKRDGPNRHRRLRSRDVQPTRIRPLFAAEKDGRASTFRAQNQR